MSTSDSRTSSASATPGHPLDGLPRLSGLCLRLESLFASQKARNGIESCLRWVSQPIELEILVHAPEIVLRPSGLNRPSVVAQFSWPSRRARLAFGLEAPLAHIMVDRLLGSARPRADLHLQVTPVEWGIFSYVFARTLDELLPPLGIEPTTDLLLDRVSPEPFQPEESSTFFTVRFPLSIASQRGSVRLWVPSHLAETWLDTHQALAPAIEVLEDRFRDLDSIWVAEAGEITLKPGLSRLRKGGILPLSGEGLRGTPTSPTGALQLVARDDQRVWAIPAQLPPSRGNPSVQVTGDIRVTRTPRKPLAMTEQQPAPSPETRTSPLDVPVTLIVELGRVQIPLQRLAELKSGDVLELSRHSREPVELTSNGRLIARGELVQIDTELGVRITTVYL